jgi:hypothetical protein
MQRVGSNNRIVMNWPRAIAKRPEGTRRIGRIGIFGTPAVNFLFVECLEPRKITIASRLFANIPQTRRLSTFIERQIELWPKEHPWGKNEKASGILSSGLRQFWLTPWTHCATFS